MLSIYCADPISSFHLLFAHIFSMVRLCIFVTSVTIKIREWERERESERAKAIWMEMENKAKPRKTQTSEKRNAEFNIMFGCGFLLIEQSWKLREKKTARIHDTHWVAFVWDWWRASKPRPLLWFNRIGLCTMIDWADIVASYANTKFSFICKIQTAQR